MLNSLQLLYFSVCMEHYFVTSTAAVYSDELTSSENKDDSEPTYIQRIPYFVLVKRVYSERHDIGEELKEQLDVVKER